MGGYTTCHRHTKHSNTPTALLNDDGTSLLSSIFALTIRLGEEPAATSLAGFDIDEMNDWQNKQGLDIRTNGIPWFA